jgi:hypothetical protein
MSEILNIQELEKMATPVIDIPNFDNTGTIKVRVRKPSLMKMATEGKIPNSLMGIAAEMAGLGTSKDKDKDSGKFLEDVSKMMEFYCKMSLVEPTYEEFKHIITDEQIAAIFEWATNDEVELYSFRTDKTDGNNNNDGKRVQQKA